MPPPLHQHCPLVPINQTSGKCPVFPYCPFFQCFFLVSEFIHKSFTFGGFVIISLIILCYHSGRYILKEKFNFEGISNLFRPYPAPASTKFWKPGSGSVHILNPTDPTSLQSPFLHYFDTQQSICKIYYFSSFWLYLNSKNIFYDI